MHTEIGHTFIKISDYSRDRFDLNNDAHSITKKLYSHVDETTHHGVIDLQFLMHTETIKVKSSNKNNTKEKEKSQHILSPIERKKVRINLLQMHLSEVRSVDVFGNDLFVRVDVVRIPLVSSHLAKSRGSKQALSGEHKGRTNTLLRHQMTPSEQT